jgi:hypothetical protein
VTGRGVARRKPVVEAVGVQEQAISRLEHDFFIGELGLGIEPESGPGKGGWFGMIPCFI